MIRGSELESERDDENAERKRDNCRMNGKLRA